MNNRGIKIFSFFIFAIFLVSMLIWIAWAGRKSDLLALFGVCAVLCKVFFHIPFNFSSKNVTLCLVFYLGYLLQNKDFGSFQLLTQVLPQLVPIVCIVCLADEYKRIVLENITKWYAWLVLSSFVIYVIVSTTNIPGIGIITHSDSYGSFSNYILYVREFGRHDYSIFPRFCGPFLEPGYLGMIGSFLLYANNFDFSNRYNKIIALSVIASLSLAGWILAIIGYLFVMFHAGKIQLYKVLLTVMVINAFYFIGTTYNDGDNLINETIISRLEYDEEKGIAGNNRNHRGIEYLYAEMWISGDTHTKLFGYPKSTMDTFEEWEIRGAGMNRFIVFNGLIGLLYVFSFYILVVYNSRDKLYAFLFFLFVFMSFWQRTYALWFSEIICFYYGVLIYGQKYKI